MKTGPIVVAVLVGTIMMGCSHKEPQKKESSRKYEVMSSSTEETARVTSVDRNNRKITLDVNGEPVVISAGNEVKNLDQIKKGDIVVVTYDEALVYSINKGGKASTGEVSSKSWSAGKGELPAAGAKAEYKATVIITNIDREKPSVTLKNAQGEKQTFKVLHPERLDDVKVGDAVDITYTEAVALKVEKKGSI